MSPRSLSRAGLVLLMIAAGTIVAGAYLLDLRQGKPAGDVASTLKTDSAKRASTPAPHATLPPSHPPVVAAGAPAPAQSVIPVPHPKRPASHPSVAAPPGADAREGQVQVDAARPYTHFRVGNNSVIAIHADGPAMWLGTSAGIVRYDTVSHEFKKYDTHDGLRANGILYLGKLQGKIAAGTYGGGLSLFDQEAATWQHYGIAEGLADGFVYDALETAGGDVWIATGSGVNRVRGGVLSDRAKWDLYTVENTDGGLPNNRVYRLAQGKDGSVWLATRGGLANFRNGKWENWTHAKGLGASYNDAGPGADAGAAFNPDHVAALEVDKDGKVWAGTRGAGIVRFDGKAWKSYTTAAGLPGNQISTLHFDRNGGLWIGTKNGLALFKDGKFQVLTAADGLLAEDVLSMTTTSDGDIWVGGFGGVAHIQRSLVGRRGQSPPAHLTRD